MTEEQEEIYKAMVVDYDMPVTQSIDVIENPLSILESVVTFDVYRPNKPK